MKPKACCRTECSETQMQSQRDLCPLQPLGDARATRAEAGKSIAPFVIAGRGGSQCMVQELEANKQTITNLRSQLDQKKRVQTQ
eukprot:1005651-Amphidinium_carterae.1